MLQNIYYIASPEIIKQPVKIAADTFIVLNLDKVDDNTISSCFQAVEQYITQPSFCLRLNLQAALTPEQATAIVAFFFFPNYYKQGFVPQIFVAEKNEAATAAGINLIQQNAQAQAFSAVQIIAASTIANLYQAHDTPSIKEAYQTGLQLPVSTANALFIQAAQQENIATIHKILEDEEILFGRQNADLCMLKKQNRQLQQKTQQLELLYQAAQQEIVNQVSHNQILRSSSQATALQNYYNNEYEVLPLWYKRLGHIIKVIMGKRSFKSLFSDNAKKYKD